ncbi:hypothetical protein HUU39_23190 [candidate division KSB1 bacterium]|nr:hypothetical protein [candidate division KSB1 bacterium]
MNSLDLHEIDLALCRSAMYEALALGFGAPTPATIARLIAERQNRDLAEIAAMLQSNSQSEESDGLAACVRQLRLCADARAFESLQISHRRLLNTAKRRSFSSRRNWAILRDSTRPSD